MKRKSKAFKHVFFLFILYVYVKPKKIVIKMNKNKEKRTTHKYRRSAGHRISLIA
jgi:hypothetical protein